MRIAKAYNRAPHRARHATEDKRASQRQVNAIHSRFGDAENPCGNGGTRYHLLARVPGKQEYTQCGPHLPHHRRQQHWQH
ncbi:hypothetical protein D3C72_2097770 [compost metagenome]